MNPQTPWFPTVFADKCDGCSGSGKPRCVDYCPNQVFTFSNGKAQVANQLNCIHGCYACEPICRRKAISFPKQSAGLLSVSKDTVLRKTICKICGKYYSTNRQSDICMDCEKEK